VLTVRAVDPVSGQRYFFLPGGAIETGESPAQAAIRETWEETGYRIAVTGEPMVRDYVFTWAGKTYDCQTYFFRANLSDPSAAAAEVHDEAYLTGVEWAPVDRADEVFAYHPAILQAVRALL
jgi:8-oxo-dGTP pyrophosphatase MutT (NUDIX family)